MRTKSNLDNARRNKNDEYYTYYDDVVKGLKPYKEYLKDIPYGYVSLIAVPISYICKHNADDFDIVAIAKHGKDHKYDICRPFVNGVEKYTRLVIRRNLRGE